MSVTWATKYGLRRVRHEPPTLEEALTAAEGIATERDEQIEIAAELMQVPVADVKAEAARLLKERGGRRLRLEITPDRRASKAVVVERKPARRVFAADVRRTSSGY